MEGHWDTWRRDMDYHKLPIKEVLIFAFIPMNMMIQVVTLCLCYRYCQVQFNTI